MSSPRAAAGGGLNLEALAGLVGSLSPDQLQALAALSAQNKQAAGRDEASKGELTGGIAGIMSANYKTLTSPTTSTADVESAVKETSRLVHSKMGAAIKAAKLDHIVQNVREGNVPLRLGAIAAGLAMIVVGAFASLGEAFKADAVHLLYRLYVVGFGFLVLCLETRGPLNYLLQRQRVFEYAKFLTLVSGRGWFYAFVGTLVLDDDDIVGLGLGLFVIAIGIAMIVYGKRMFAKLQNMQGRFRSEAELKRVFTAHDADGNGSLDVHELATLCREMGALLTRGELETALLMLDRNADGKVTFEEFVVWWKSYQTSAIAATGV